MRLFNAFKKSVWIFPSIVFVIFFLLVIFKINGSSIGVYHDMLSSPGTRDNALIAGKPLPIRSDEWIVTTQMIIGQKATNYQSTNQNIGQGENANIMLDVPTRNWSQIFRPHNWAFLVMPFDNAFAYRWWFPAIILMLATYFLALKFLPKQRLLATFIAISFFFSGFIQWWYIGSTLNCLAYPLLICIFYVSLLKSQKRLHRVLYSFGIFYSLVAFAIILYPPFQIPAVLATIAFLIGYTLQEYPLHTLAQFMAHYWTYLLGIGLATALCIGLFLVNNWKVVQIVQNTAYPGRRIVQSGGYSITQLSSGTLARQHQKHPQVGVYSIPKANAVNPSEASTFIFLSGVLAPILLLAGFKNKSKFTDRSSYILLALLFILVVFLAWLFIPRLEILGVITKLNVVPQNRLIIGMGLLNALALVVLLQWYKIQRILNSKLIIGYSCLVFIVTAIINYRIHVAMPSFVSSYMAILLALPLAATVYFILSKRYIIGMLIFLLFSFLSNYTVNPLYYGTAILTNNSLSQYIRDYPNDNKYWIAQDIYLENIAIINGKKSLSGVFSYPQKNIWYSIDSGKSEFLYNRYAHVSYNIDQDPSVQRATGFVPTGADQLVISTEICSNFIKQSNVGHIVSSAEFSSLDQPCIKDSTALKFGEKTFYVYNLKF